MAREVLDGRYQLQKVLGRGGVATVWRAEDVRLREQVAVKVLGSGAMSDPGTRERLRREAKILSGLAHPNIVAIRDMNLDVERAYLVMEFVPGVNLTTLLNQGPLPVPQAAAIALQVCDALDAAHRAGVLHRDIKPGNLMVGPDGHVTVCDFGVARSYGSVTLTGTSQVVGTSEYLAPERALGEPGDGRSDLYALGCVLYAMLTGSPPFTGRNAIGVAYQQVHQAPQPPSAARTDLPPQLDRVVLGMLAKDPDRRPPDADAVAALLRPFAPAVAAGPRPGRPPATADAIGRATVQAPPATRPPQPARPAGWRVVVTADPAYHDWVRAHAHPDAPPLPLPASCPERQFALDKQRMLIGRRSRPRNIEPDIDLTGTPDDTAISHAHALLVAVDQGWVVVDLGSANGTYVNGSTTAIDADVPVPIRDGDQIHLGAWTRLTLQNER